MDGRIYTNEQWEILLSNTFRSIENLGKTKGSEYSGDLDRLANFRRNAERIGLLQETVWAVYAGKHWDAISTYIKKLQATGQYPINLSEPIEGRVDDLITYLLLFKAMIQEATTNT